MEYRNIVAWPCVLLELNDDEYSLILQHKDVFKNEVRFPMKIGTVVLVQADKLTRFQGFLEGLLAATEANSFTEKPGNE